jgi:glycosyltransferase involved in cell wall biosynthesis
VPLISVVIPARNERKCLRETVLSIVSTSGNQHPFEIIVVDDASSDGGCNDLQLSQSRVRLTVIQERTRLGIGRARNRGVLAAKGDILFITDAHMTFPWNWTDIVVRNVQSNRILAATIADVASSWRGFGCSLVVPYMGTSWNIKRQRMPHPVQIASSAGTILERNLFHKIGGYDVGMITYGAAEPEFSLRAWLSGAEIISVPELELRHRFQKQADATRFLNRHRSILMHNNIRFGLLYLSRASSLQMLRHYAMKFPRNMRKALKLIEAGDVWERRASLQKNLVQDFAWFINKFDLTDQIGLPIL